MDGCVKLEVKELFETIETMRLPISPPVIFFFVVPCLGFAALREAPWQAAAQPPQSFVPRRQHFISQGKSAWLAGMMSSCCCHHRRNVLHHRRNHSVCLSVTIFKSCILRIVNMAELASTLQIDRPRRPCTLNTATSGSAANFVSVMVGECNLMRVCQ